MGQRRRRAGFVFNAAHSKRRVMCYDGRGGRVRETREGEFDAETLRRGDRREKRRKGRAFSILWRFVAADATWGFERGETRERGDEGIVEDSVSGEKTKTRSTGQSEVRGE